jgi:excisionase family DNA binding protein
MNMDNPTSSHPPSGPAGGWLNGTKEEAKLLRIHPQTLLEKARLGRVPGMKIGGQWRFHHAAVLAALTGSEYVPRSGAVTREGRDHH